MHKSSRRSFIIGSTTGIIATSITSPALAASRSRIDSRVDTAMRELKNLGKIRLITPAEVKGIIGTDKVALILGDNFFYGQNFSSKLRILVSHPDQFYLLQKEVNLKLWRCL